MIQKQDKLLLKNIKYSAKYFSKLQMNRWKWIKSNESDKTRKKCANSSRWQFCGGEWLVRGRGRRVSDSTMRCVCVSVAWVKIKLKKASCQTSRKTSTKEAKSRQRQQQALARAACTPTTPLSPPPPSPPPCLSSPHPDLHHSVYLSICPVIFLLGLASTGATH